MGRLGKKITMPRPKKKAVSFCDPPHTPSEPAQADEQPASSPASLASRQLHARAAFIRKKRREDANKHLKTCARNLSLTESVYADMSDIRERKSKEFHEQMDALREPKRKLSYDQRMIARVDYWSTATCLLTEDVESAAEFAHVTAMHHTAWRLQEMALLTVKDLEIERLEHLVARLKSPFGIFAR